jgi:ubiquitin C-terminal hydrolase
VEAFGKKLTTFKELPGTLTFALKRFDFDGYGAKKNYRRLQVPQQFEIPQDCLHPDLKGNHYPYAVVSCVEHEGGFGGGHYLAHSKHDDGRAYRNDDLQDGPRKETEQELNESLARAYLYVFQRVEN